MEPVHVKIRMKGQGSPKLVSEAKKERMNDNSRFFVSVVLAYSTVFINDLGLDKKVFCRRSLL